MEIDRQRRAKPDVVKVKLQGPKGLVLMVLEAIERDFISVRTSQLMKNSSDSGVHVFVAVMGSRG